jgi:uncharacterized protein YdcH (DUF465 family)
MEESKLKERLLRENAEFRNLFEEHQRREKKLTSLKEKHFLSEDERLEEKELKKKKLALKDRMYEIMRDFQRSL